jgi:phosphomannomutase
LLEPRLPFAFEKLQNEPDGSFPNGIPNPMLPERRAATAEAVRASGADLGIAWDGDFDRCFFFDECGEYIEGYYLVGLLAAELLAREPGAKVIYDPRLTWNSIEQISAAGGTPIQCKSGHAFMKERMRQEDALYGGEMSAHHYFRSFRYCDSGMIPWLLVCNRMCREDRPISAMVSDRVRAYPCSGEINFQVTDATATIEGVLNYYAAFDPVIDRTDGIGLSFPDWRFNLRASNTEPLIRLNVESRDDRPLMEAKTAELTTLIRQG